MTNEDLATSYLQKSIIRRKALDIYFEGESFSDVVREGQELVELCLKGILRRLGIDPPKLHDVGALILEKKELLIGISDSELKYIALESKWLRKERELAMYGDLDFIPSSEYSIKDAERALAAADAALKLAKAVIVS
jgi:HEPN domain-containing protein